jgi:hypothetical protein
MKVLSIIQADLETGGQGLPSLLAEDLAGEPVLRRTASRVAAAKLPEKCVVLAGSDEANARVRGMLDGLPVEVVTAGGPDVAFRRALWRSRCWARNGWRGGIGGTTVFDEEATPAKMLSLAKSRGADALVEVSPAAALIDPGTIDGLLRWVVESGSEAEFYFAGLPPGLTAALYSVSVLEKLVALQGTIRQALVYHPGRAERDAAESRCCYPGDDALRFTPFRLAADSPRALERLRAIFDDDATAAVKRLRDTPALWPGRLPDEIEFAIAAATPGADPYAVLAGAVDMTELMDVKAFEAALGEIGCAQDVNVTFGGLGDPLGHPQAFEFIDAARRAGAAGIHLATSGRRLDDEKAERLAASDLDAISIRLWADTEDACARVTGRRDLARVTALVEKIIDRRKALGRSTPFVIPEMVKSVDTVDDVEGFFDRWYGRADWPVIRGFNDFAGQVPDRDVLHPYPGVRFPCLQLFRRLNVTASGDAIVCGQDIRRTRKLGNVFEEGFASVWHGPELERLRAGHVARDYSLFELCGKCRHWYQL